MKRLEINRCLISRSKIRICLPMPSPRRGPKSRPTPTTANLRFPFPATTGHTGAAQMPSITGRYVKESILVFGFRIPPTALISRTRSSPRACLRFAANRCTRTASTTKSLSIVNARGCSATTTSNSSCPRSTAAAAAATSSPSTSSFTLCPLQFSFLTSCRCFPNYLSTEKLHNKIVSF